MNDKTNLKQNNNNSSASQGQEQSVDIFDMFGNDFLQTWLQSFIQKPTSKASVLFRNFNSSVDPGHVDMIPPDGEIKGVYAPEKDDNWDIDQWLGLDRPATVGDLDWMEEHRPQYVDGEVANAEDLDTLWCTVPLTQDDATSMQEYWDDLEKDPGRFSILGNNCATHAADSFAAAGLIDGIDGLDTPANLYETLKKRFPDMDCQEGYFNIEQTDDGMVPSMTPLAEGTK